MPCVGHEKDIRTVHGQPKPKQNIKKGKPPFILQLVDRVEGAVRMGGTFFICVAILFDMFAFIFI